MTYTVNQIAERYGVDPQTVTHWIRTGQLKAITVGREPGKIKPRYRVTVRAIKDFEESRIIQPPKPRKRRPRVKNPGARRIYYAEN